MLLLKYQIRLCNYCLLFVILINLSVVNIKQLLTMKFNSFLCFATLLFLISALSLKNVNAANIKANPKKKSMVDYIEEYSRPSVDWYKGIMVEQAKEWEIMGYDVRETRSAAEGFEVMSEKVKNQQRKAFSHIHFHKSCSEVGHTPGMTIGTEQLDPSYRSKVQQCADPNDPQILSKCDKFNMRWNWAQYIGANEDYINNMPGFDADPFNKIPGNPLVMEPCNTLSNGAYYKCADVPGIRATRDSAGDEDLQQAAANMAYGSFYYHGHGDPSHWDDSRFADVVAMDLLFGIMFEQMLKKTCKNVDCMNDIYTAYFKEGDQHARQGMHALNDAEINKLLLTKMDEFGQEGKGFQTKYYTQEMADLAAKGKSFSSLYNKAPKYSTIVTGIVITWLRITFNRDIPFGVGDKLFDQVSSAIIEALVPKSKDKKKAKNIRDIIRNANLKVVSDVPEAFWKLTKMLQKFLSGMHFQEVKAGASIMKVFGRYDTCPFQPHSNWHRFSARLIQMIVHGINVDLDACGLKDKYSLWQKATIGSKVSANIAKMGSSTAGILSIARLGMEPKLQEGDKGFQHQVAVNEALRAAIEARVRSNNRKHHADYNSHKRRRLLSMDNAFLQRATVNKANAQEQKIMKAIQMKGGKQENGDTMKKKGDKKEKKELNWNSDYRNACNLGPRESSDNVYDNFVKPWVKASN